jgi:NADPH-dependent glutamate synthase beta subunit-like oxidoreductase
VFHGRFDEAYAINLRDNVFPGVLGRVCSRPCEDACRHGRAGLGEPVAICFSKRTADDHAASAKSVVLGRVFAPTGKRVVVIGAGVAGLAVARELALWGHTVQVLERHVRPGGMLNQGIPAFRLPRDVIEREIAQVVALGVEVRCGVEVGREVVLGDLLAEHDAVVVAAGTLRGHRTGLPGEDARGIEHGLDFLLQVNEQGRTRVGRDVTVIGGGYTAMDCARTALRLGARVTVRYRRARGDMVVLPGELEEFVAEGGVLETQMAPTAFDPGPDGHVVAVRCERTRATTVDPSGRRGFEVVPGSACVAPTDHVILATGQGPDLRWIDVALGPTLLDAAGRLASGTAPATAHPKLFVAGDHALGATTLIRAIGHAKAAARAVDRALVGRDRFAERIEVGPAFRSKQATGPTPPGTTGRTAAMNAIALHPMPVLPPAQRAGDAEVERGYDAPTGRAAASRCYLCHWKFEIVDARCVLCDECIRVKPVDDCIVEIAGLLRDDAGRITGHVPVEAGRTDSLYYHRLWIDQDRCVRCGQCEAACPTGAITIQKVSPVCEAHG